MSEVSTAVTSVTPKKPRATKVAVQVLPAVPVATNGATAPKVETRGRKKAVSAVQGVAHTAIIKEARAAVITAKAAEKPHKEAARTALAEVAKAEKALFTAEKALGEVQAAAAAVPAHKQVYKEASAAYTAATKESNTANNAMTKAAAAVEKAVSKLDTAIQVKNAAMH